MGMTSIKEFINFYGLAFMLVIMIPNIIFAVKNKDGFEISGKINLQNYLNKLEDSAVLLLWL